MKGSCLTILLLSEPSVTIRARSATVNSRTAIVSYLEIDTVIAIVVGCHGRSASVCVASVGMTMGIAKEGVRFKSLLS